MQGDWPTQMRLLLGWESKPRPCRFRVVPPIKLPVSGAVWLFRVAELILTRSMP